MDTSQIDRRRRFVFRGNAAAISGRIVRPTDLILDSKVSSSLTVAGGRSTSSATDLKFEPYARVKSAETSAVGLFDDVKRHEALTFRQVSADSLTTSTRVTSELKGVEIGLKPVLKIKRLRAALRAKSPVASGEPSIQVDESSIVEGVEIGGHELIVRVVAGPFQKYDTHSKLMMAVDDPAGARELAPFLLLNSALHGAAVPPTGRLLKSDPATYATVVEPLKWAKDPYPESKITDHTVYVPGFGKIIFGELLLTGFSRRLTMLRVELGSPEGGDVAAVEVESNGIWA